MRRLRIGKYFLPVKMLIPILLISVLSIVSYAASVTTTTTNTQTIQGILYNVAGGFSASANGFVVTQSSATATSLPATWSNTGTVTTATVAGNWQYSITVTINAAASPSTTYQVTVQWNTGGGYSTLGIALTVTTLNPVTPGQTMTFVFNTGVTTFNAPVALLITIQ